MPLASAEADPSIFLFPFLFFVVGGLSLFGIVFAISRNQQKRSWENLEALGAALGLPLIGGKRGGMLVRLPELRGSIGGRDVRIFAFSTGSGKSRQQWCAIHVGARNPAGLELRLSEENLLTRVGRKLGLKERQVGDAAFDARFFLKAKRPEAAAVLLPEWRAAWREALPSSAGGALALDGRLVRYEERGLFTDVRRRSRFIRLVPLVARFADAVDAYPQG